MKHTSFPVLTKGSKVDLRRTNSFVDLESIQDLWQVQEAHFWEWERPKGSGIQGHVESLVHIL